MNFILLSAYYPEEHKIYLNPQAIVAFARNVLSPKSKGSTVYVAGATIPFQVLETTAEIDELLEVEEKRG